MSLLFLLLPLALLGLVGIDKNDDDDDLPPDHGGNDDGPQDGVRNGTSLNDMMDGTAGNDRMAGLGGDDVMLGARGSDTLGGGSGNDVILGEAGHDSLSGDHGDDVMLGGKGNDTMAGGPGEDAMMGGAGADLMLGGADDDLLMGGTGADTLYGGAGDDLLMGVEMTRAEFSDETLQDLQAGLGRAVGPALTQRMMDSFTSADTDLSGDRLWGDEGNDTLVGDAGDTLTGGAGVDDFWNHLTGANPGMLTITDYTPGEQITLQIDDTAPGVISLAAVQNGMMIRLDGQDVVLLQSTTAGQVRLGDIGVLRPE